MANEPGAESPGKIAIVAPHATPVPMDGGSIRTRAIAEALANAGFEVLFFGREAELRITREHGAVAQSRTARSGGKLVPALLALARRSHYVKEKHMPSRWVDATVAALESRRPDIVLLNFVWSQEIVPRLGFRPRIFLDTHNNEVEWFENLLARKQNAISGIVCRNSIRYALDALERMDPRVELIHVSERDRDFYAAKRPDLAHWILPNGCMVNPRTTAPDYHSRPKQLFFLGSLSTSMNQDALTMFSEDFWPTIKDDAGFTAIGSNPPPAVRELCEKNGWMLAANPTDGELDRLLLSMHYSVLPFAYGAGSKLKLLDACGRGIPVISTLGGVTGFSDLPRGVFVSGDPGEWRRIVEGTSISQADSRALVDFATSYSWKNLVDEFVGKAIYKKNYPADVNNNLEIPRGKS